jgi:uncharacterized membrane protein YjjP (DUF1212 family)
MIDVEHVPAAIAQASANEAALLDCLRKIGKGLVATGVSVGVVENTLIEIGRVYDMECEVMALPNVIMIKLGESSYSKVDFAVQRLTTLQLDQESEFVELVYKVRHKDIALVEASRQIDRILSKTPRFGTSMVIFGYFLSCIGLTLLYRPELSALAVTGAMGILVGILVRVVEKRPRYYLLLPIFSAILVSTLVFNLTRLGFIFGPANLLITPLIIFLPGALLTTGMIELASAHILSGSSRLIYGAAVLLLLFLALRLACTSPDCPATWYTRMRQSFSPGGHPSWVPHCLAWAHSSVYQEPTVTCSGCSWFCSSPWLGKLLEKRTSILTLVLFLEQH